MYVVRLKSIDGIVNFRAFRSRTPAISHFEAGESLLIDESLNEAALFDVVPTSDPRANGTFDISHVLGKNDRGID